MNKNGNGKNLLTSVVVFILAYLLFRSMGCGGCTSVGCAGCVSCASGCARGGSSVVSNNGYTGCTQGSGSGNQSGSGSQSSNAALTVTDEFYINDYTSTLTEADKSAIVRSGEQLEKEYGAQLIAVVINDESLLSNDALSSFTYKLFNDWGVGSSSQNNGMLLVINIAEGDYIGNAYCVEGTGLENLLPASEIGDIITEKVLPKLDERQFAAAASEGYQALAGRLTEIYGGSDA